MASPRSSSVNCSADTTDPDWAGQLRVVAHEFRRLALQHPKAVALLVTRPLATSLGQRPPGMLRPLEDGPRPPHLFRLQRSRSPSHLPGPPRLPAWPRPHRAAGGHRAPRGDRQRAAARSSPAGRHRLPEVRALASDLASYDGAAELDRSLNLLLSGLSATIVPPKCRPDHDRSARPPTVAGLKAPPCERSSQREHILPCAPRTTPVAGA